MRADDFYHFETLLNSMDKGVFIKELIAQRDYAVSQIATFYEKNNRFQEAIELYDLLLKKYPDSERLLTKKKNVTQHLTQKQ